MAAARPVSGRQMSVTQAAKTADCAVETIRRAIRSKELPATRHAVRPGRPYQVAATDLAAFLEKRRTG